MWADQQMKDLWQNLDDVANRLRRGNVHYHNMIEVIAALQDALQTIDGLESRMDRLHELVHTNHH